MTQKCLARSSPAAVGADKAKVLLGALRDRGKTEGGNCAGVQECGGNGDKACGEVLGTVSSLPL